MIRVLKLTEKKKKEVSAKLKNNSADIFNVKSIIPKKAKKD